MSLLAPLGLLFGLLALPILVLYMLKLRRREVQVSSTLLWQALLRDRQANAPWQRIKRNLLLFLQLLILTGLVLGLARPALKVPSIARGSVVVLLDASASMAAQDVQPNRFEAARQVVHSLIDGLSSEAQMTMILVASQPQVLAAAETDKTALSAALSRAQVTQGTVNWEAAFALAAGAVSGSAAQSTVVILSDGGLPQAGLPSLPAEVRYLPIGASADNLAISALAVSQNAQAGELFASVTNYSPQERQAVLSIYADGTLFSAQLLDLPPGESRSLSLQDLPTSRGVYQARLSNPGSTDAPLDALPLDDRAFAVQAGDQNRRILLVSQGNFFLEQALAAVPGITPFRALPDENGSIQLPSDPFDLYIFDGMLANQAQTGIPDVPQGNLLLIDPPPNPLFTVTGEITPTGEVSLSEGPLMQYVSWKDVNVLKMRKVQPPAWAELLVSTESGPLVFAGETGGRRVAAITFDLHDSDLPLQVSFPILLANLIQFLVPAGGFDSQARINPGDSLRILPAPDVEQIAVASPTGQVFSYLPQADGVTFNETGELGIYAVNYLRQTSQTAEYFAVNLFAPLESNIQTIQSLQVGGQTITSSQPTDVGLYEIWPWLVWIALGILILEWWFYHRRGIIPQNLRLRFRWRGRWTG